VERAFLVINYADTDSLNELVWMFEAI